MEQVRTPKTSTSIQPLREMVLLKAIGKESIIILSNDRISDNTIFEFKIAGYGQFATGIEIGDKVQLASPPKTRVTVEENTKSIKQLQDYYRSLSINDKEAFEQALKSTIVTDDKIVPEPKAEFVEYFLVPIYEIIAVIKEQQSQPTLFD